MRKITLLSLFALFLSFTMSAQILSTGTVTLNSSVNYTIKFDIDTNANEVTITMTGDMNRWLGIGPGVSQGNSMGNSGDDVITYTNSGLQDRNFTGSFSQPNVDSSQDWNVVSDNVSGGIRTVIATRARITGDSNDFEFPTSETSFPVIWANGNSLSFGQHSGSNRGGTMLTTTTLSNDDFNLAKLNFKIYPNPSSDELNISLENLREVGESNLEVYNVLGQRVLSQTLKEQLTTINVQEWNRGVYFVKISSGDSLQTLRFIRN